MNPISRLVLSSVPLFTLSLFPLLGCDDNSAGSKPQLVEQVALHIENVPADVACVRITAAAPRRFTPAVTG